MKARGRTVQPLSKEQIKAVNEYLTTDKSMKEVAEKYKVTVPTLRAWRKKLEATKGAENNG